jgi:hypothetical protein
MVNSFDDFSSKILEDIANLHMLLYPRSDSNILDLILCGFLDSS